MGRSIKPLLIFRADGSAAIGTGHVMRCLALAEAWRERGGAARFITAYRWPALEARLRAAGCDVLCPDFVPGSIGDARWSAETARQCGAAAIVVDGYHFGSDYQQAIKDTGIVLLFIDDDGRSGRYSADVVLNQNLYAREHFYRDCQPYTQLLLGAKYALLRREFLKWREWRRDISATARNLLVTLGGADAANVTEKVIAVLRRLEMATVRVKIVAGAANSHLESLRGAVADDGRIELLTAVDDVAALMAWADVAISAGGSTCWELAFMGLPSSVVVLADNQLPVARSLDEAGAAIDIGAWPEGAEEKLLSALGDLIHDPARRRRMSEIGRQTVDGGGARRVAEHLWQRTSHSVLNAAQEA
jgi:UDP-2,4-diacetamido-2,4,6-trideoxy-beta-L-altropyranose hydrolase